MTPAARRDKLERWFDTGKISMEQYWEYQDNPDTDALVSLKRAAADDIRRTIEDLEDGKYRSPSPMQDLVNGVQLVNFAYLRLGDYEDVPQKVLTNFVKWISMARAIMRQGTAKPNPMMEASGPASGMPQVPGLADPMLAQMGPPGGLGPPGMGPPQPGMAPPMMGPPGMPPV
jgi:hypothetical protein